MLGQVNFNSPEDSLCESLIQGSRPPIGFYRKSKNRILVVRYLVEVCLEREGKNCLQPLRVEDFKKFNLYSLLTTYYNCSPRKALQEAYKEELKESDIFNNPQVIVANLLSGVISEPPRGFWTLPENRRFTTEYLVLQVLKLNHSDIYQVNAADFINNGLGGFLTYNYACSPIKALMEAFPSSKVFLFNRVDPKIWENQEIRKECIQYFLSLVPLDCKKITFKLLINLGLKHSLAKYYQGDIKKLLQESQN